MQVICTVLSADLVTAHDILCINGASAALMLSPMPFFGPIGAVRVGEIDGQLVVNPTLPAMDEGNDLDLIVVGTKDGLTMVEAGANQVPEERLLEALEIAHEEIKRICAAQEELRELAGKPKWLDAAKTEELEAEYGPKIAARIGEVGLREAGAYVDELQTEIGGAITMDSTEEDVTRRTQARSSLALILEKIRLDETKKAVRAQFETELKAFTDAEQDSKELKSAKRSLLFDQIIDSVDLPFPVGPDTEGEPAAVKDALTKQFVKKAAEAALQGARPHEDRRRQAPPRRARRRGDPPDHLRCRRFAAHARLGPLHPRPDADPVAAHPRHRQGGPADRRPLAGAGPTVHAPLQLPALLGRRDRVHARAEAP